MTSKGDATEAFVWIWLPGATEPGGRRPPRPEWRAPGYIYGASYCRRKSAIPIYGPELTLQEATVAPINGLQMASCIHDGSPDAWDRRLVSIE